MKKLLVSAVILGTTVASAQATGPANPMENYTPTSHSQYEINRFWQAMRTDVKNKDCYRRAHLWSYTLDRNYGVKSSKIFIHFTDKFNKELDNLGREDGLSWFSKKFWKADGLEKRIRGLVRSNITWDYHVAPMVTTNDGKEVVLDRTLPLAYDARFPYTLNEAWELKTRPSTPEEWVEALTIRGELLWKARKAELEEEMSDAREDARSSNDRKRERAAEKYHEAQRAYMALGMDKSDSIDIKCKRVESIAEVDKNHNTEWCFYSTAPMYYYNEIDLRYLAYGETGYRYSMAPPMSVQTEDNYKEGRRFSQYRWNEEELEDAAKEIKPERN